MPPEKETTGEAEPAFDRPPSLLAQVRDRATSADGRKELVTAAFRLTLELVTFPFVVVALFHDRHIDPAYGITWPMRVKLAWRMYRNSFRVFTATSYKAHLAMAVKLFEVPKSVEGVVVECGSFRGGSAANLSLACALVDRDLVIYDSFQGMPPPKAGDKYASEAATGAFAGSLDAVRSTIERLGAIERCTFRPGWFEDSLRAHREPIVLCFLDVDWQASLHDCLTNLWPHLVEKGWLFIDEYVLVDFCAVFFSERYWRTYFDCDPPGLLGSGTGVPLGNVFLGPFLSTSPFQHASSIAYTWKGNSGLWDYYPSG